MKTPREKKEKEKRRAIIILLIILVIASSALGITFLKKNTACKDFRITSICPTSQVFLLNTTGSCRTVTAEVLDSNNVEKASFTIRVGEPQTINMTPNIPPGQYTLVVKNKGKTIGSAIIKVYPSPFIAHARALAMPNGTITITFLAQSPPCLKSYGVSAVIVIINGTKHEYTGHWTLGQLIRINTHEKITPSTQLVVILVDTLGRYYKAGIARPI